MDVDAGASTSIASLLNTNGIVQFTAYVLGEIVELCHEVPSPHLLDPQIPPT